MLGGGQHPGGQNAQRSRGPDGGHPSVPAVAAGGEGGGSSRTASGEDGTDGSCKNATLKSSLKHIKRMGREWSKDEVSRLHGEGIASRLILQCALLMVILSRPHSVIFARTRATRWIETTRRTTPFAGSWTNTGRTTGRRFRLIFPTEASRNANIDGRRSSRQLW